jgi:predicted TIM-barrel fold metal-dependent hydrolase
MFGISKIYTSCLGVEYPTEIEITSYNDHIHQFMKEHPGLVEGYVYLNPNHGNSINFLRERIEEQGFSGMKLWIATLCNDPKVFPLIEQCIEYDVPILVHAFQKSNGQYPFESMGIHVADLSARYPEAKIIMAHLGGNCYHGTKSIVYSDNVWVDFSGSLFNRDEIDYTKKKIGARRILFGTDMPGSYLVNLGQVEEAELTPEEKEDILWRNAHRLFDRNFKPVLKEAGS